MTRIALHETVPTGTVQGVVHARFEAVAEAFVENFRTRGEVGAALALMVEGETVLDLWGGTGNPRDKTPWVEDTICGAFSCTKGAMAILVHMLVEQGQLDLDRPVTDLWPEYGQNGKGETTLRMMLDHTCGIPVPREPMPEGAFADWEFMTQVMERAEPWFEPGTRSAYHAQNFSWTVGEMIRRATGVMPGDLFAREIAGPLGLEFWIGLPDAQEPRLARLLKPKLDPGEPVSLFQKKMSDTSSVPWAFLNNTGNFSMGRRDYRAAQIGASNGIGTARALARLYAPLSLGGAMGGKQILRPETIARMMRISNATHMDATLCLPLRFGAGVMRSADNRYLTNPPAASMILSETAFGHPGSGGSLGFADPQARLSFGYIMNQQGMGQLLNRRGQTLVDAAYTALGYRSNHNGAWTR